MPKKSDDGPDEPEETWPAILRIGTVARYLDCSTSTVNKMISERLFPEVKYGPGEGMRGVRRLDLDAYLEGLQPEFTFPEMEFEFSRPTPKKGSGPGSRLLFLKKAINYFRDDRDSWKRRALYSERHLERTERQLLSNVEQLLPDKPPEQGGSRTAGAQDSAAGKGRPMTRQEYLERTHKTRAGETMSIPVRQRPGEFETVSMEDVAKRIVEFWDLPTGARGKLVFGGWRNQEEVAQASDEELLQTKDIVPGTLRTIRKHIPKQRRTSSMPKPDRAGE